MHALVKILVVLTLVVSVLSDCYMHNPRGHNNRLNEDSTNRDNANRLCDTQNNGKGGYCWGPPMTFYEGSLLQIEWTTQHGCGADNGNVDCDIILQYMCQSSIRDGLTTDTITLANMNTMATDPNTGQPAYEYGMNEDSDYYIKCTSRQRNMGLFTADQNLGTSAVHTRQNPGGSQYGFECQEERDYYPYWHPTPWRDIAVLTSQQSRCAFFQAESQNVKAKNECSNPVLNNANDCNSNSSQWVAVRPWGILMPDCNPAGYTRDNHLGNTRTGMTDTYSWTIPSISTIDSSDINADGTATCVLRIRYNISTGDYDGWGSANGKVGAKFVDYTSNGRNSPVYTDPYYNFSDPASAGWVLRLAIDTAQYGRTFQDRSYLFKIAPRPSGVPSTGRIYNINVRGKRGNIVEAYPAVEYDFTPNSCQFAFGDMIHFQWTGCDTNPNYAGEGTQGTDRSNVLQITDRSHNMFLSIYDQTFWPSTAKAFEMAFINQYGNTMCTTNTQSGCCKTYAMLTAENNPDQDPQNCAKLNDPGARYFDAGVMKLDQLGTYSFMSSRNNNFSNRSQKMTITISSLLSTWGVVIVSIGGFAFTASTAVAATSYYASTHPASAVANFASLFKL